MFLGNTNFRIYKSNSILSPCTPIAKRDMVLQQLWNIPPRFLDKKYDFSTKVVAFWVHAPLLQKMTHGSPNILSHAIKVSWQKHLTVFYTNDSRMMTCFMTDDMVMTQWWHVSWQSESSFKTERWHLHHIRVAFSMTAWWHVSWQLHAIFRDRTTAFWWQSDGTFDDRSHEWQCMILWGDIWEGAVFPQSQLMCPTPFPPSLSQPPPLHRYPFRPWIHGGRYPHGFTPMILKSHGGNPPIIWSLVY